MDEQNAQIIPVENENEFYQLLEKFFSFSLPKVYDAKNLAIELAKRTRFLRDEEMEKGLLQVFMRHSENT